MKTEELNDLSLMSFGMHKGKPMQDVPVEYLHWCWTNLAKTHPVNIYVKKSLNALKLENKDLIWS